MIFLQTEHPIAKQSKDTKVPGGSMMDSTSSKVFAKKARHWFKSQRPFALLDLGCSDGSAVFDILNLKEEFPFSIQNIFAAGLEGSDYPLMRNRGFWKDENIGNNLFLCDITEKFDLYSTNVWLHCKEKTNYRFDIITAWEVIEHLPENRLDCFISNVTRHLMPDGLFLMSISEQAGYHHENLKNKEWWLNFFAKSNLVESPKVMEYFDGTWLRGSNEPNSFNLGLRFKDMEDEVYFK